MKAKIRGTEIYFDVAGMQFPPYKNDFIEKPILFLLHGGPGGNHFRYKQHSAELQQCAQILFIDSRGCGYSKKTKQSDYSLSNDIDDIEALRKYLGIDRICLLGTSYGGIVAQGYAIRYPKHLNKLILVATAPSHHFIEDAKKILEKKGNPSQIAAGKRLFNGEFKNRNQIIKFFGIMNSLYSVKKAKKRKKLLIGAASIWSPEVINKGFKSELRKFDFRKKLKKIKSPTLILAGKEDWICPPNHSKQLKAGIPHAQLKIFNHCSHAVAIDQHKKYIHAIELFLKKK